MLELFKPLQILKNKDNPVIFSEFCYKLSINLATLDKNSDNNDNHPFIIFYDKQDNSYYYLKARGAYKRNGDLKNPDNSGEIVIRHSENGGYFYKDSYVDCSQIFKIDADLLESLVDKDCWEFKHTLKLDDCEITKIKETINQCCNEIPPYLSILEVKLNEKGETYAQSLYLCDKKVDEREQYLDCFGKELNPEINLDAYVSLPNAKFSFQRKRYNNAIEFIKMFQKEYFYDEFINTDYQKKYFEPFFDNSKINDDIDR